ncbi:MAG: helix-turn-helix domain-containing protein [Oscillospiraceae bacterium]|nr:helix-turn-helix domain-containing protein [Oscillospiraceae bacterium]
MQGTEVKISAYIQPKKKHLYAVITYYLHGQRQIKWRALGLPDTANRQKASKRFREVVERFGKELQAELGGGNRRRAQNRRRSTGSDSIALSAGEAAEYMKVNQKTLYKMLHDGKLPYVRIGREYRIPQKAVMELFATYKPYHNAHRIHDRVNENKEARDE